jgi:DeoR/GlpR family transcriptional regulator of sugar metabolism
MLQLERLERIREYLVENEYADINRLKDILEVSGATVRRCLKRMEVEGTVILSRGGATLSKKGNIYEYPYQVKQQMNAEEKRRIAFEAVKHVHRNESIFLDSSTTVFEMTKFLVNFSNITVATNDIYIAQNLNNAENLAVTVIGGTLRRHYYTLTGYFAETALKGLCFDRAFLGIDALSLKSGFMITNIEEVQVKSKVISCSKEVVVLCDHSKFNQESFLNICGFKDIDMIITGAELDKEIAKNYSDEGVNLILI